MRFGAILLIIQLLIISGWSSENWWISSKHPDYSSKEYWLGVGQASNARLAKKYAAQEIAKQFQQSLSTRNRDTQVETKASDGKVSHEEFYYSKTQTSTNFELQAVEYPVEMQTNQGVFVLAVVSKSKWLNSQEALLTQIETEIDHFHEIVKRDLLVGDLGSVFQTYSSVLQSYQYHQKVVTTIRQAPGIKNPPGLELRVDNYVGVVNQMDLEISKTLGGINLDYQPRFSTRDGFSIELKSSPSNTGEVPILADLKLPLLLEITGGPAFKKVSQRQTLTTGKKLELNIPIGADSVTLKPMILPGLSFSKSWIEKNTKVFQVKDLLSFRSSNGKGLKLQVDFQSSSQSADTKLDETIKTRLKTYFANYLAPFYSEMPSEQVKVICKFNAKEYQVRGFARNQQFVKFYMEVSLEGNGNLKPLFAKGEFNFETEEKDFLKSQVKFLDSIGVN